MSFVLQPSTDATTLLTCSIIAAALFILFSIRPYRIDRRLPGPKRHWLLGVTFADASELTQGISFEWSRWPTLSSILSEHWNYQTWGGPTLNLGFGGAFFNVVSPHCLQYILRDNFDNYPKGKLARSFRELFGKQSPFVLDGSEWKWHRKIIVGFLGRDTIQTAVDILQQQLQTLELPVDTVFDLQEWSNRLVLDIFGELGFGIQNLTSNDKYAEYVNALDELQYLIHLRFEDLLWEYKQRFRIGAREKRVQELNDIIDGFAFDVIQNIKESPPKNGKDIVSRYLSFCKQQNHPTPTNKELRDFVVGYTMTGRDTTATTLTWTLYELTRHPVVVDRLREEVLQVCGLESISMNLLQDMTYLHCVVMESLRLHPAAPENFRFAIKDDLLPDGTKIPAGSLVMFSINTINHNPKLWYDPEEFIPDRFINSKEPSPFKFATFIGGPRMCPGKGLALMEIKMIVATLIQRYDFHNVENHDGDYHWTLVMAMKGGLKVRARHVGG